MKTLISKLQGRGGVGALALILSVAVLTLGLLSAVSVRGHDFDPSFDAEVSPEGTTGANDDVLTDFGIPAPQPNFSATITFVPPEWGIADSEDIPDGAYVGTLSSLATLGMFNNPCDSQLPVDFDMYDGTIDTGGCTVDLDEQFETQRGDPNLDDGIDCYPEFLNTLFPGITPRARQYGHATVAGALDVSLNFVFFEPGTTLPGLPSFSASQGYPSVTVLNDPTAPVAPGVITDFCTPLTTTTNSFGLTRDNSATVEDESGYVYRTNPCAPGTYTFSSWSRSQLDADNDLIENDMDTCPHVPNHGDPRVKQSGDHDDDGLDNACDAAEDDDGDTVVNDGCAGKGPASAAEDNGANPCGGFSTALCGTAAACDNALDDDGDGWANDGCPAVASAETAPQCADGPIEKDTDPDNDVFPNRQDNCPLVANADQLDEDNDAIGDVCDQNDWNDDGDTDDSGEPTGFNPNNADGHGHDVELSQDVDIDGDDICEVEETATPTATATSTPTALDTDGDGFDDALEIELGSDPNDAASTPEHASIEGTCTDGLDNDKDGLTDDEDEGCAATPTPTEAARGELCPPVLPGLYNGRVTVDGQSAASGNVLTALIDGQEWASATVSGGRYAMDVPAAAELPIYQPDCFPEGGTVVFELDGMSCEPSVDWAQGVQNVDLDCAAAAPPATPPAPPVTPPPPTATPTETPVGPPPTGSGGLGGSGSSLPLWAIALLSWAGLMTMAGLGVLVRR